MRQQAASYIQLVRQMYLFAGTVFFRKRDRHTIFEQTGFPGIKLVPAAVGIVPQAIYLLSVEITVFSGKNNTRRVIPQDSPYCKSIQ